MTFATFPAALIDAAAFERDRRAESYPAHVDHGRLGAEQATLDYQAWCAIAEWMASGRCSLIGGWGGVADPPVSVISWAVLEESAEKALATVASKLERLPADDPDRDAWRDRHEHLWCIHHILEAQREAVQQFDKLTAAVAEGQRREAA